MAAFTTIFAIAAIAASTGLGVYQQVRAGRSIRRAGEQEQEASESVAGLYDWNATIADLRAEDALVRGEEAEAHFRATVRQVVGAQRAGYGAANIDVNYGSAVDVQADAEYLGELDALTIRTNAAREAWGMRVQGADLRARAVIARREGANAAAAGREGATQAYLSAGSTLLGAGSSLLMQRYGFGRPTARPTRPDFVGSFTVPSGSYT